MSRTHNLADCSQAEMIIALATASAADALITWHLPHYHDRKHHFLVHLVWIQIFRR